MFLTFTSQRDCVCCTGTKVWQFSSKFVSVKGYKYYYLYYAIRQMFQPYCSISCTHTLWRLINAKIKWPGRCSGGGDTGGRYAVAQEIQLRYGEHALLSVEDQVVGGEDGEQRAVQFCSLDLLKTLSASKKEKRRTLVYPLSRIQYKTLT